MIDIKFATPGTRVAYIPGHSFGDIKHPDVEHGIVSSSNGKNVFVKFDRIVSRLGLDGTTSQSCCPEDLVLL
jgi:hypothetical protein